MSRYTSSTSRPDFLVFVVFFYVGFPEVFWRRVGQKYTRSSGGDGLIEIQDVGEWRWGNVYDKGHGPFKGEEKPVQNENQALVSLLLPDRNESCRKKVTGRNPSFGEGIYTSPVTVFKSIKQVNKLFINDSWNDTRYI